MYRKPLSEFSQEHGQTKAADLLGLTQGALSKALRRKRAVFVCQQEDGTFAAEEVKPFPAKPSTCAA